jgi:hypothetical protein
MTSPQRGDGLTGMPPVPPAQILLPESGTCCRCGAPATISEGDGFGPDRYVCDAHSLFRNATAALPGGYHARTLGFPAVVPYSTGQYAVPWPPG